MGRVRGRARVAYEPTWVGQIRDNTGSASQRGQFGFVGRPLQHVAGEVEQRFAREGGGGRGGGAGAFEPPEGGGGGLGKGLKRQSPYVKTVR